MNPFLRGLVRAVAESFDLPEPILEIGSYRVAGQEDVADLRTLFPGREYIGIDNRPGPGVDLVANVERLPHLDQSVGTVVAISTFEHVPRFWKGFEEVHRVLRPGGAFLIASPFHFHIHEYPSDYWRFTPEALQYLLGDYPSKILGWHGPDTRPSNVWALAFREGRPPIDAAEFAVYREKMDRFARMPLPWLRRWRYRLGRLFFGSRPFAPWLRREHWQAKLVQSLGVQSSQFAVRSSNSGLLPSTPNYELRSPNSELSEGLVNAESSHRGATDAERRTANAERRTPI